MENVTDVLAWSTTVTKPPIEIASHKPITGRVGKVLQEKEVGSILMFPTGC